jgi:hypothetical protein
MTIHSLQALHTSFLHSHFSQRTLNLFHEVPLLLPLSLQPPPPLGGEQPPPSHLPPFPSKAKPTNPIIKTQNLFRLIFISSFLFFSCPAASPLPSLPKRAGTGE